ncbi:MAG: roadblock/LC7 domain-containing protein [Candidatus Ranarchaeia archaeon]
MSSDLITHPELRETLQAILEEVESKSQLEALAVVTWSGIRIASSSSTTVDADEYSAASAAIVSLGDMSVKKMNEGRLMQVVVRGDKGYTILTRAGPDTLVVGVGREQYRFGYYLDLLIKTAYRIAEAIAEPMKKEELKKPVEIEAKVEAEVTAGTESSPFDTSQVQAPAEAKEPVKASTERTIEEDYPALIQTVPIPEDTGAKEEERKAILEALKVIGMIGEEPGEE